MKKVNFKKRLSQLMAGVFGLALMGGVMLSPQEAEAQDDLTQAPISAEAGSSKKCQNADASGGGGAFTYRLCSTCKLKFMTRGSKSECSK